MDRTTVFNTTHAAAAHRQEERRFGEQIHRNLNTIALFHRASAELERLLAPDMFHKPNTVAFGHVAHFLFTLLDPREFRRSFYWPCRDKAAESNFRTAAVALMNTLIERHGLQLAPIKMHNVVLPGGLKFQRILYEFTVLAMREVLTKEEQAAGAGSEVAPVDNDIRNVIKERQQYQANAQKFFQ